jgi:ADP-ribose pyrophosphatase YjhB (NUDIX family)
VADELKYIDSDDKHYVNIGFLGVYKGGEPKIMEPEKCKEWRWVALDELPDDLFEATELIIKNFKAQKIY